MKRNIEPIYNASLSSMWAMKNFTDFADFFPAACGLGFARVELNHQVTPAMLKGVDLKQLRINSIHEPCPAFISAGELKNRDLLISSPDEERRREGLNAVKRSLDLARELGCEAVVVHCGQIQADTGMETRLRQLFENGQLGSPEFLELQSDFSKLRASLSGLYLQAVKASLLELLDYALRGRIRLGIENRFHFLDIPIIDEMGEILALAGPERLGFVYDVGHAQFQDRLGFCPYQAWLDGFGSRIIGVHIHDAHGVHDHLAPGMGEVDFKKIALYLPPDAFRTLEVKSSNTPEQIRKGMNILVDTGCVSLL